MKEMNKKDLESVQGGLASIVRSVIAILIAGSIRDLINKKKKKNNSTAAEDMGLS